MCYTVKTLKKVDLTFKKTVLIGVMHCHRMEELGVLLQLHSINRFGFWWGYLHVGIRRYFDSGVFHILSVKSTAS
jgi:hypothetical protein